MPWGKDKWDEDYRDKNRINCYQTGTAPCKVACPAHIAVEGYIKMVKEGRFRDALALIKKIILSLLFVVEFVTKDVKPLVLEAK